MKQFKIWNITDQKCGDFCVLNIGNKICFNFSGNNCNQLKTVSNRDMSNWSQYCHNALYRVPQEECARLREGVPYVKIYRYNPKYLCPKLNGYGDNGQRKVWSSGGSTHCTCQLTVLSMPVLEFGVILWQFSSR
jgi:hypothetical protein